MLPKITKINSSSTILLGLTLKATELTSAGELNSSLNSPTSLKYPQYVHLTSKLPQNFKHNIKYQIPHNIKHVHFYIIQS